MNLSNDSFISRVLAVESRLGLDIIRQNPRISADEWRQKCEEAIAAQRPVAKSEPMRGSK